MQRIEIIKIKILPVLLFLMVGGSPLLGQNKQICFSFDDLPLVNYDINDTLYQETVLNNLLRSLIEYDIPAIGFVNELDGDIFRGIAGIFQFSAGFFHGFFDTLRRLLHIFLAHHLFTARGFAEDMDQGGKNDN